MAQEVLNVKFTNGGIKQLKELKEFFKTDDMLEVIKLGIAYLQKVKEMKEMKVEYKQ